MEQDSRKVQVIEGHASSVYDVSSPYASVLEVSGPFLCKPARFLPISIVNLCLCSCESEFHSIFQIASAGFALLHACASAFDFLEDGMSGTRRSFLQDAALLGAGLFGWSRQANAQDAESTSGKRGKSTARLSVAPPKSPVPVVTPDVPDLPFEMDGAVKVFRLKAEPLKRKIAPFKTIDAWGYNGSCPGPTMQIKQGDRVRIIFENALPESTSMHWHGLEVPIDQDGVPWISQKPVLPAKNTSTNSRSIRKARFSITRTAPCRK